MQRHAGIPSVPMRMGGVRRNRSGKEGEGPADSAKEESHRLFCRCPGHKMASILEESLEHGIGTGTVYQGWEIDIVLRS